MNVPPSSPSPNPHEQNKWSGSHHEWSYRKQAFRWDNDIIDGINFVCIAKEMRAWLMQLGELSVVTKDKASVQYGYTNPYSATGTTLCLIFARCVNSFHDYAKGGSPNHDKLDAEVERIRIYNELLIYAARLCEVSIKQLLYCTAIPESFYKRMALGGLLSSDCMSCRKDANSKPHQISLIGTLAHPYGLCREFELCANDHMDITNKKRNSQAAHSNVQLVEIKSVQESKLQLFKEGNELLESFLHLLLHIEKLEMAFEKDLTRKAIHIKELNRNKETEHGIFFMNLHPGIPVKIKLPNTNNLNTT